MSYKLVDIKDVVGIRKVRWDDLWHVLYKWGSDKFGKETWDRVSRAEAMQVLRKIEKSKLQNSRKKNSQLCSP